MYACGHCDFTTSDGIEANRHEDETGHIVDELDPTDSLEEDPTEEIDFLSAFNELVVDEGLERENPKDLPPWRSPEGWEAALDRADLARKQEKGE